jgi:pantothenate kinase
VIRESSTHALVDRARRLAEGNRRAILGITGAPGAGKSTLSAWLADELADVAVVVGMDGFHLSNGELARLGRRDRKGAPDTFDVLGYLALLERLRRADEDVVYAPEFRRDLEESVGSAVPVPAGTPLVVTEGNYLLLDSGPWARVRGLLDEAWYVDLPDAERERRLIRRHVEFGRTEAAAEEWVRRSDARNADLVARTVGRADVVVDLG